MYGDRRYDKKRLPFPNFIINSIIVRFLLFSFLIYLPSVRFFVRFFFFYCFFPHLCSMLSFILSSPLPSNLYFSSFSLFFCLFLHYFHVLGGAPHFRLLLYSLPSRTLTLFLSYMFTSLRCSLISTSLPPSTCGPPYLYLTLPSLSSKLPRQKDINGKK